MIIHNKMVEVIRNALVDYESATGLECQIRYADRLSAVVEVVLELSEDSNVGQARCITVPPPEPVVVKVADGPINLDEDMEEMADDPPKRKRTDVDHEVIRKMLSEGVTVNEISEKTGAHISTIYKIKKTQRIMEAK